MAFVTLGTVAPGDVLRANSGTAAYNNVIGNLIAGHPIVSTLPGSPADGDTIYYQTAGMATDGVVWTLRYRSGGGTYKWEFVGGAPYFEQVMASGTTTATNAVSPGTIAGGPSVTVPAAGEYIVGYGANIITPSTFAVAIPVYNGTVIANWGKYSAYATNDREAGHNTGTNQITITTERAFLAAAAGNTLDIRYRVDGGTGTFLRRWLRLTPVRLG